MFLMNRTTSETVAKAGISAGSMVIDVPAFQTLPGEKGSYVKLLVAGLVVGRILLVTKK